MVKCPRCGYENVYDAVYCDNCAYLLADTDGRKINNTRRTNRWNISTIRKVIIVLGFIIIALLLFSFIYNLTQPSQDESLNVIGDDGSISKDSSYPYRAVIKYDGDWYAEMGDPNYLVTKSGQGTQSFGLDCASWDKIAIDAQKQDYGEGPLTIQLLRNGEVVAEQSTTNVTGHLVINYNY